MKAIGVRELRQRASEFLREVEQGRTVEVTAHGRPIAHLVPAHGTSRREALIARGRLAPGKGDVLAAGKPLQPAAGVSLPGQSLVHARNDER